MKKGYKKVLSISKEPKIEGIDYNIIESCNDLVLSEDLVWIVLVYLKLQGINIDEIEMKASDETICIYTSDKSFEKIRLLLFKFFYLGLRNENFKHNIIMEREAITIIKMLALKINEGKLLSLSIYRNSLATLTECGNVLYSDNAIDEIYTTLLKQEKSKTLKI